MRTIGFFKPGTIGISDRRYRQVIIHRIINAESLIQSKHIILLGDTCVDIERSRQPVIQRLGLQKRSSNLPPHISPFDNAIVFDGIETDAILCFFCSSKNGYIMVV